MKSFVNKFLFTVLLTTASAASAVSIGDNYIGATPRPLSLYGQDVVGDSTKFDVSSMDVNISGGSLRVGINSNYFTNTGALDTQLGDLFISTNGWNPEGAAPYTDDDMSNGESWEYVLVLDNHDQKLTADQSQLSGIAYLYQINQGQIVSSDDYFLSQSSMGYRMGQEVQFKGNGTPVAIGSWSLVDVLGSYDRLNFTIGLGALGTITDGLGFHWTMTCANDVIQGGAAVPEPTTVLLFTLGFLGAARLRRAE